MNIKTFLRFVHRAGVLISALIIFFSFTPLSALAADEGDTTHDETIAQLSREQLNLKLDELRSSLAALSDGADASDLDKQNKVTLQRQLRLLEEYASQKDSLAQLSQQKSDNSAAIKKAQKRLDALAKQSAVNPSNFSAKGLSSVDVAALENQLSIARDKKSNLSNQQLQQQNLEDELPAFLQSTSSRYRDAEQRELMLTKSKSAEQNQAALAVVNKQIENTQIDKLIAKQAEVLFEARRQWYRSNEPLVRLELEVAEIEISHLEQKLAIYHQALQEEATRQAQQAEQDLQDKERTAKEAKSPDERFLTSWAASVARSQKNISSYQAMTISLTREITDQKKWLAMENDEFITITQLLSGQDNYDAADRIRRSLLQLRQRRDLLEKSLGADKFTHINEYRERSFAITDILYSLTNEFENQRQAVLNELDEAKKSSFQSDSQRLLFDYRNALRDEKSALTEVINSGQKLTMAIEQRLDKLDEFERYVRSTSFWIRDSKPLSLNTLFSIPGELFKDLTWLKTLTSAQSIKQLSDGIKTPESFTYAITLFVVLPLLLYLLRRYLRSLSIRINDRVQSEGKLIYLAAFVLTTGLLSAAVLPAYFFIVARLAELARLPADLSVIVTEVFDHLALFFLLWFFSRSFFAGRSITEVQFDLPRRAANELYTGLRWYMLGYLLLLPSIVLRNAPFNNQVLPQLFNMLFLMVTLIAVYRLIRPESEFVQHQLGQLNNDHIVTSWSLVYRVILLSTSSTLVLSGLGYQYASQTIIYRLAATLMLLALLPPIYRQVRSSVIGFVDRRVRKAAATGAEVADRSAHKNNTVRLLKSVIILFGVILLLRLWGVNEQVLLTFDNIQLYKVQITGSEPEFVTLGSYMRCILAIFIIYWTMRSLPGFMNLWIFPHWSADVGVKYAVTTTSRYVLFLIGVIYIVSELHLDLAKLGWLMAAIGVGLGFGLQEIVSNFVSGLILLAERPVKPGDIVTIGELTGTVSHINIRATTIVNFDRQEVMVPNRNLITNEVINWTRSDTINRVVVLIGVAYGSDLDHVTDLLMGIAKEQPKVLNVPPPSVFFTQHGESSLDLELRVFVSSPDNIMPVRDQINRQISKVFTQENIEIPFPQRDLHIRSGSLVEVVKGAD